MGDSTCILTLQQRVDRYRRVFTKPKGWPPPQIDGDKLYGTWLIGNNYAAARGYYGEYPPTYLRRMYTLFPETPRLHLFSGSYRSCGGLGTAVDCDPETPADVHCEIEAWLDRGADVPSEPCFNVVFADPPYSREEAENYDAPYPNKRAVIGKLAPLVEPGGHLIWLDTSMPIWAKADGWRWGGMIAVFCGTNRVLRGAFILRKAFNGG